MSVSGWKTAASEKGEIKLDSSRNDDESPSLVLSAFTLLSLHKHYSELEQKAGTGIKVLGLDPGSELWRSSAVVLLLPTDHPQPEVTMCHQVWQLLLKEGEEKKQKQSPM